jgi:predicted 3-demethylubiquinone-9 3-methyltransferase (glyoxalase superfamily)
MQKITTFLWFDNQAEEAANFYVSIFKNSTILGISHYGDEAPRPKGSVLVVNFQLDGQNFMALNGGPSFKFTEAISLVVNCETQQEVDEMWEKLSAGGEKSECGWLKDKYGLWWQVVPAMLGHILEDKNAEKTNRVMKEIMKMDKLDIKRIQQAYDQK